MNVAHRLDPPMLFDEYLAMLDRAPGDTRYELIESDVFAMAGGTFDHEQIAANVDSSIKATADRVGCFTLIGNMLLKAPDRDDTAVAPDVLVRCGEPLGKQRFVSDPTIVVEVTSPSTGDLDRGRKMEFYKTLPSLRQIVLVYQDEWRVETWTREGDAWSPAVLTGTTDRLPLHSLGIDLPLTDIYRGSSVTPG